MTLWIKVILVYPRSGLGHTIAVRCVYVFEKRNPSNCLPYLFSIILFNLHCNILGTQLVVIIIWNSDSPCTINELTEYLNYFGDHKILAKGSRDVDTTVKIIFTSNNYECNCSSLCFIYFRTWHIHCDYYF